MSAIIIRNGRIIDPANDRDEAADLFIFGSNVECAPLVLYESMAAGTPFLSVSCGNAAEIAQLGGGRIIPSIVSANGRINADSSTMARLIEELMADDVQREQMAKVGREVWRTQHEWEHIVSKYESLYERLIASETSGAIRQAS